MWRRGSYEIVGDWFREASTSVIDTIAEAGGAARGSTWLDVATGTGAVAIEAARRGARVTAVDLTGELLDIAQARADRAEVDIAFVLDEPMPGPDMTRWADGVDGIFAATDLAVVEQRTATQEITFLSPSHAASEMERWSGGWTQLFEHFDSLDLGQPARDAFVEHLGNFGTEASSSFVLHADYVVTVLQRPAVDEAG